MNAVLASLALVSMGLSAAPAVAQAPGQAAAQVAGAWRVTAKVSSFGFTLNCDFKPDGARFGGICVDASTSDAKVKTGRAHRLTSGRVEGRRVTWTYPSSFLFTKFDVTFKGALAADRLSGVVTVQGHDGTFTATRP